MQREIGGLRAYARHREAQNLPGTSLQAVQDAIASGRIRREPDGKIDFQLADMMWSSNTDKVQQARAHKGMPPTGNASTPAEPAVKPEKLWADARARREQAQAELAELQLKKELGEVVGLEAVLEAISDCNIKARNAMMQIPDRLAGQLAVESDVTKVYELLSAEIANVISAIENGALSLAENTVSA